MRITPKVTLWIERQHESPAATISYPRVGRANVVPNNIFMEPAT
jgi:hypothetical protein